METIGSDFYATLGLDRRCTSAQIRDAYRLLVRMHHPDVNPDSAEAVARTQELNAAYEVLSDSKRRRDYDRAQAETKRPGNSPTMRSARANVSQDVLMRIEEFIRGTTLTVRVNDPASPNGGESYELTVPAGTAPGTRFSLRRAAPFDGGQVQVRVKVRSDARFKVRGSDLRCDLRINSRRAGEGGTELVNGPGGLRIPVMIPRGVARGTVIRVPGEGLPKARSGRGDLLVRVTYRPEVTIARKSKW